MDRDRLEQLKQDLRSASLLQRKEALDALAQMPSDVAVPLLQDLWKEPDFALRRIAVMGFGNHRSPESFAALCDLLQRESDPNVISEAANSIFEFGEASLDPLQQLFARNTNWLVRQTVLSLLIETDYHEPLLAIARQAIQDPTQSVKESGILALGKLLKTECQDEALALLTPLAADPDWRTRWRTATALRLGRSPEAKALLRSLQQDDHFRVVAQALEGGVA